MVVESKKKSAPPLPAPTESNSTIQTASPSDAGTDVSKPADEKSSYSLPDDGTPVTIRTGHRTSRSQTSLLIEYFEGGKASSASGPGENRRPSVRVRLTPSSKHRSKSSSDRDRERDRIEITQTRSRRASLSRRSAPSSAAARSEPDGLAPPSADAEDASSYASATEESSVSRHPIDIEIDRSGNVRRRRPASPLIPAADSKGTMSDVSAIPADSFLDGSGAATSVGGSEARSSRSRSPSRTREYPAGAASGLSAAEKPRNRSRDSRERERVVLPKSRDKDRERKHKSSKSRTGSLTSKEEKYAERSKSPRRRSKGHTESFVSGANSSVVSSALSQSHSVRSATSKASSINNPKLLETVEDAIRRLILPELNALKREQSRHKSRRDSFTSSTTTISRDDFANDRRRSAGTDKNTMTPRESMRSKESRDREARNDLDDSSALSHESIEDDDLDDTPTRGTDRLKAAAAGAAMGVAAAAVHEALRSPSDDKQPPRRRRRAEMRNRASDQDHGPEDEESETSPQIPQLPQIPPMPLMSDVNPSDVTRASILSAETDRPHSASEEIASARHRSGEQPSPESTPTPTRAAVTLQTLGTQHANVSHGDLKELPRQRTGALDEYVIDDYGNKVPSRAARLYREEEEYDDGDSSPPYAPQNPYDYYSTQDVPPPLKYVPYHPERRGLSPIPSVSGYTEGSGEVRHQESRATHRTGDSLSSFERSPRQDGSIHSQTSREFGDDDRSMRSPGLDQGNATGAGESEHDPVTSGRAVHAVGLNPDIVHPPGVESNVASLVDNSMLDGSALTGDSSAVGGNQPRRTRQPMAGTIEEKHSRDRGATSHREYAEERAETPASGSQQSREFAEYELDEYGRKVRPSAYRRPPTTTEAAITSAAVGAAAAVLRAQYGKEQQQTVEDDRIEFQPAGVQRNKSFKERTKNGPRPGIETASDERLVKNDDQPKTSFSSMPDPNDPMPEIGGWQDVDILTNPSLLNGESGRDMDDRQWSGDATPRQHPQHRQDDIEYQQLDGAHSSPDARQQGSGHDRAGSEATTDMAAAQNQNDGVGEEQDEWGRTSEDRKRDTLVTNPYEGSSPVANLAGINDALLGAAAAFNSTNFGDIYGTRSPLGHKVDEGYISQGPNKTPDIQSAKGKGVDYHGGPGTATPGADDPFYGPGPARQLSCVASPLYDGATGTGIEQIESKDIIALMQHLMVRDAQRSARDTEILVTLVRAATEMRNNFEDLKRLLADTEDVIITEVKENTEKTVQRAINGPRPYPGSTTRSIHGGSQAGTINGDDVNAKKRSIFRRALKGLSAKGANDLSRIEDMLMQLLNEVDVLKAQTTPSNTHMNRPGSNHGDPSYDQIQPEVQYEQDHGYEPEGNAGTSTTSHGSQSGHLSVQSRGASAKPGYDRKLSAHRISTVHEDNEDDYDHGGRNEDLHYMTPAHEQRGNSVPLVTPPGPAAQTQTSASNENTPRTEDGKKPKSGRSSWFRIPKISRWSETTASSGAAESRHSKQSSKDENVNFPTGPSHSGSLDHYQDNYQFSPLQGFESDKLHTGFSDPDLAAHGYHEDHGSPTYGQMQPSGQSAAEWMTLTPEEAKYKAHRDSLNLQHPQPRPGQTERFKAALESQALGFDSPLSPKSADWAGSATSLSRFAHHQHGDGYGSADDHHYQHHWTSSPAPTSMTGAAGPPPRPPKEAIEPQYAPPPSPGAASSQMRATPPQNKRISKLQKQGSSSPLPHHSVESGYGTMTHGVPTASYVSHHGREGASSPRLENRNLSGALSSVNRRPSGPRPMTPTNRNAGSPGPMGGEDGDGRRKRDTFGIMISQEADTF